LDGTCDDAAAASVGWSLPTRALPNSSSGSGFRLPAGALPELLVAGAAQSILGALAIKAWDSARDLAGFLFIHVDV
jgi:hypothetical protein